MQFVQSSESRLSEEEKVMSCYVTVGEGSRAGVMETSFEVQMRKIVEFCNSSLL